MWDNRGKDPPLSFFHGSVFFESLGSLLSFQ